MTFFNIEVGIFDNIGKNPVFILCWIKRELTIFWCFPSIQNSRRAPNPKIFPGLRSLNSKMKSWLWLLTRSYVNDNPSYNFISGFTFHFLVYIMNINHNILIIIYYSNLQPKICHAMIRALFNIWSSFEIN